MAESAAVETDTYSVEKQMRFQLPEPPNIAQGGSTKPGWDYVRKNRYMKKLWHSAVSQGHMPLPPAVLKQIRWRVSARFRLHSKRDPTDNLPYTLKWVLDGLKANQGKRSLDYRDGLYVHKGFVYDDSDRWVERGTVEQRICRIEPSRPLHPRPSERGLELVLTIAEVYPVGAV